MIAAVAVSIAIPVAIWRRRGNAGAWDEDRMLGGVHQLGRDLLRTDCFRSLLFFTVGDDRRQTSQLFRLLPEIGERDRTYVTLDAAQRDALAEDVHGHHFRFAKRRCDNSAFLREALAALDVELVLVTQTSHQTPARPRDLRRVQR